MFMFQSYLENLCPQLGNFFLLPKDLPALLFKTKIPIPVAMRTNKNDIFMNR